ncbi:hypothetical protein TWF102_007326 [Orbilia oligospora]|uniref:PLAC8-domain-containing protein n=1 Tax=Orbilia oligospora TaxID=2813651 RepID=A0A7C8J9E6_ORBOL|nr:hypothetical protein TWF103_011821 [Orbilia oligospora]KAF3090732.1 hypothetical protein TWF103_011821 [Orbilia oligospora]KAF3095270.1 hypothetical protein TWF102_007326 [Orbilia oligospora]KAF3095271.1 hypothetical protein TWF102_007326 [Orbilia oligospora]KAF3116365.1 hypothetical protein TWF706_004012 [Orbilia oligospora]
MSYQPEPKTIYPDHQAQAPYGQPIHSPPPNYQQQQQQQHYPQPDHQQQFQQSPPPQQFQQSPPPPQQYPTYQEHQHSPAPQPVTTPVQPTPQPQMEHKGITNHAGQPGPWEHGMCGCFGDCGKCCVTFWCPCITYSKIQHRLRHNDMSNYSNCNGSCWGFCALSVCGFQWVMSMIQRGEIRQRYNLQGSGCGDCCRHFCCECCTLIQEDRETETRKALLVPANQAGYQQSAGMTYPQH